MESCGCVRTFPSLCVVQGVKEAFGRACSTELLRVCGGERKKTQ